MNLMDLFGGPYPPPAPEEAYAAAPPPPGGLAESMGLNPNSVQMALRSLAAGMSGVKNSAFPGEVGAHGLGAALTGGHTYQDQQEKIVRDQAELDRAHAHKQATLGETSRYHTGLLDRGKFQFLAGTGKDEEGKDVPGMHVVDVLSGQTKFQPHAVITGGPRGGSAGRPPAKVAAATWLREKGIAKDDAEAWTMVNAPISNQDAILQRVYTSARRESGSPIKAQEEVAIFRKILEAARAAPTAPAPAAVPTISVPPPAPAPVAPAPRTGLDDSRFGPDGGLLRGAPAPIAPAPIAPAPAALKSAPADVADKVKEVLSKGADPAKVRDWLIKHGFNPAGHVP